jgi:hypothetical protein
VGFAEHSVFEGRPNVEATGATLPVMTTRYREQPPSSAQVSDAAQ